MEKQRSTSKTRAFTLIELLIVVAIIAILAAIAVPNFLEAQTRAKIARMKADMRTIATGVEAYTVDWNRPQPGNVERTALGIPSGIIYCYIPLTTPVAYLTSVPIDPFADKQTLGSKGTPFNFGGSPPEFQSIPSRARQAELGGLFTKTPHWGPAADMGYTWLQESHGPSKSLFPKGWRAIAGLAQSIPNYMDVFYDATNGTMSLGFIVRSNKMQH